MENFEYSTTFEYKGFVKRKIYYICYMIINFFTHETCDAPDPAPEVGVERGCHAS